MKQAPTIILTGATAGIGRATAQALAPKAGTLILVARNEQKLQQLLQELAQDTSSEKLDYIVADLSEPVSVQAAIQEIRERYQQIDILINNAGGYFSERKENSLGYEYTFALNHLAFQQLTMGVLDLIQRAPEARIINLSSAAHKAGKIYFDDLMLEKDYSGMKAYAQSKLANVLFTKELARRLADTPTTVNAVHPGVVATNFTDNMPGWAQPIAMVAKWFMISPEKGAETSIYLATDPEVANISGDYFAKKTPAAVNPLANDPELARRLWEESERLIDAALAKAR